MEREIVLDVKNLKQYFKVSRHNTVKAIDDVTFQIYKGEVLGLVGESGSGKSTTGRSVIRIYQPTAGQITFLGEDISKKMSKKTESMLRQKMQMIFQDPMACLNPRMKVIDIIAEGLDVHKLYKSKEDREKQVMDILEIVGLNREHAHRYPHEFSGGQRQRIGIARAMITNPAFIIADEPISALDVSIQAQVVNLMKDLQVKLGLTMMFIAHDLSMVRYISDRVAVMHLGHIVEMGSVDEIYENPKHPYTKSLLSAIPEPDPFYEKNRVRIKYSAKQSQYEGREIREISPGHWLLGNDAEIAEWTK